MPRNGDVVLRRLQEAALELFDEHGYDRTTSAAIAARAGVTERTFFRHFPDKREVLFGGEMALSEILTGAIREVPPGLGAWDTLFLAFQAAVPLIVENRAFAEPRRRIIAGSPRLQEREMAKTMSLTVTLATALRECGVDERTASLAAQMGMAAFGQAFVAWLDGANTDLDDRLAQAFSEVHDLVVGRV